MYTEKLTQKKQLSITENCFCVKLALLTKNYLHLF